MAKELGLSPDEVKQALKELGILVETKDLSQEKTSGIKKSFLLDLGITFIIALLAFCGWCG